MHAPQTKRTQLCVGSGHQCALFLESVLDHQYIGRSSDLLRLERLPTNVGLQWLIASPWVVTYSSGSVQDSHLIPF